MTQTPLELSCVSLSYDEINVLNGTNLKLEQGSVTGLLGRNGCGKTTLMRVALGLMHADGGEATVFGVPSEDSPSEIRRRIGYVPQAFDNFSWMKVKDCVEFVASFYQDEWNAELIARLIKEWRLANRKIGELSPGDQQKVSILLGIGHMPDLLLLDEPVAKLDPAARREFLRMLVEMNIDHDQTILLSSHITSDVERICSHIAILHEGRIVCQSSIDALKQHVRLVTVEDSSIRSIKSVLGGKGTQRWVWYTEDLDLPPEARVEETTLEDLFIGVTT
ncbi:MAG: ABC transporter ATP-binding protein [Gammaproteobacteria bacterium]|nr:ABC transporter ATP-binding protein [Gammaproteobacteria bacterium]